MVAGLGRSPVPLVDEVPQAEPEADDAAALQAGASVSSVGKWAVGGGSCVRLLRVSYMTKVEIPCCKCGTPVEVDKDLASFRHWCPDCFVEEVDQP